MNGVLGIAVSEVILDEPQIVASVGEVEAAGVAQHVRVDRRQPGPFRGHGDEIIHGLARERLRALRHEEPGQRIRADGQISFDGAQLIAGDRMLDRQPVLEPADPQPRVVEVDLVAAQADRLADAQTMTKHRQNEQVIADPVAAGLGGVEQGGHFAVAQKILAPLMRIRGGGRQTFYISPLGEGSRHHRNSMDFRWRHDSTLYRMRVL